MVGTGRVDGLRLPVIGGVVSKGGLERISSQRTVAVGGVARGVLTGPTGLRGILIKSAAADRHGGVGAKDDFELSGVRFEIGGRDTQRKSQRAIDSGISGRNESGSVRGVIGNVVETDRGKIVGKVIVGGG